jgi:NAD+ kinase
MKNKFSKIALSSTSQDERVISIARQIFEILSNVEVETLYDDNLSVLEELTGLKSLSTKAIVEKADLLIAIGGDGTMLNCSKKYGSKGIPVLGINLGKLGFLTDIAPEEITTRLIEVIKGNFVEDKRFFLEASVQNQNENLIALNEIVIHSGAIAQLIEFNLFINDHFVYRQKADGLIINSPTGSTAYSLSGGGPIVHPGVDAITLLLMFPQSLSTSSLLVRADSSIRIELTNPQLSAQVSFDSHDSLTVKGIQEINISKSTSVLNLIHPLDHDFFGGCRNKLGWSSGPIGPLE